MAAKWPTCPGFSGAVFGEAVSDTLLHESVIRMGVCYVFCSEHASVKSFRRTQIWLTMYVFNIVNKIRFYA